MSPTAASVIRADARRSPTVPRAGAGATPVTGAAGVGDAGAAAGGAGGSDGAGGAAQEAVSSNSSIGSAGPVRAPEPSSIFHAAAVREAPARRAPGGKMGRSLITQTNSEHVYVRLPQLHADPVQLVQILDRAYADPMVGPVVDGDALDA